MSDYPPEWESGEIQKVMYAMAGYRCEHCGCEFVPGTTLAKTAKNRNGKPRILTVHHLRDVKSDVRWENLLVCCQNCHLHIQGVWQPGGYLPLAWNDVPDWLTARGLPYKKQPQLSMFGG
jgi:hypothetical protein